MTRCGSTRAEHRGARRAPGEFRRWKNADYDKIVDEVYVTDPNNVAKLKDLFHAAMEIWMPELPDIQLVQNFHRIPMNTTLLDELAHRGKRLHQRRVLAPDLPDRAVERAGGVASRAKCCTWPRLIWTT